MINFQKNYWLWILLLVLSSINFVQAADFFLITPLVNVALGDKFWVDVRIDSEEVGFNAAQSVIKFPKDILEVIDIDRSQSVFGFWLEDPVFSNEKGEVSFIGGSGEGSAGRSLQVLRINFRVKGIGTDNLVFTEGAITASDGSGTNILSMMRGIKITSATGQAIQQIVELTKPVQITRLAVPAGELPIKPKLELLFYPDPNSWYNASSPFFVNWQLPPDIRDVATALDRNPDFSPLISEGLFDNKQFLPLEDGVWYLHVRFRNNLGWGPTAHYRLAVDRQPPIAFEVIVAEGGATDNPMPVLQFNTSDALSGIKEYQVRIDNNDWIKIPTAQFDGSFKLPLQMPGERRIIVRATDNANNSVENSLVLKIIPLVSPTITFVTRELFSNEEGGLAVKGISLADANILLRVYRKEALMADGVARADEKGNWEFTFDQAFKNGNYKVTAQSQDARGALSLIIESPLIKVKSKPIIQIGPLQLGKGGAAFLLLLVLIAGFGGGIWFYKKRQEKLTMRVSFAESEITKIFQLIREDVERLAKARETPATSDDEYAMKRLQENIQKMEVYLKKGVEKIKK